MSKIKISELVLYRYRFWIGYGIVALALISVLALVGLYLPGGLSPREMQSAITSSSIDFSNLNSLAITDLPYHLLQYVSISILGVSVISIKLPSLVLAFLSAVGLALLLRRWFRPRIGVLGSLLAITTGQFLFIAQDGTPNIMYLFWPVWLILIADLISRQERMRTLLIIAFISLGVLSLYTPLSIYVIIAIFFAVFLHPHLRYIIRHISKKKIIVGALVAIILVAPLTYMVLGNISLGLGLLGIPPGGINLGANLDTLLSQYIDFNNPGGTTIMTPFFDLGSSIIITLGAFHIIQTRAYAKSYVMILWALCLAPFIILNPQFISVTYLPLVILLTAGLGKLVASWYVLFPFNPYARFAGLLPIIVLIASLTLSGADRYVHSYLYDKNIVSSFSYDLKLLPSEPTSLIVSPDEKPFYEFVAKHNDNLNLIEQPEGDQFAATRDALANYDGYSIDRIITSSLRDNSDRFYIYKNSSQ
jgi:hypothetical protein